MLTIGLTLGDPKGIGPEIIFKALENAHIRQLAHYRLYGDAELCAPIIQNFPEVELIALTQRQAAWSDADCGHACIAYLEQAVTDALRGTINGVVTAPISKANLQKAGYSYPGHTEFLAEKTGGHKVVMMMASPTLKVTLVTIHVPLQKVPQILSEEKIIDTVHITYRSLQRFWGIAKPRLAICGLNPHAGEQGVLGDEEIRIIAPALKKLALEGYPTLGPLVPDAVFHQAYEGKFDAVVCMYHDQGLIPFKMLHFKDGVNVTLGLPIIRTSPDHGVAYDIVGKGIADPSSMISAIELAAKMAEISKPAQR